MPKKNTYRRFEIHSSPSISVAKCVNQLGLDMYRTSYLAYGILKSMLLAQMRKSVYLVMISYAD